MEKENQGKMGFDIKNKSIKSIEVLIDNSNKTNLGNQLVSIFNQMKNQLVNNSIYTDSKIIHYYKAFFQRVASDIFFLLFGPRINSRDHQEIA